MKSLSTDSFANDNGDVLLRSLAIPEDDPQRHFTNFQWYLYHGRDTVFFTVALRTAQTQATLSKFLAELTALAPQLTYGFVGARPGEPLTDSMLKAITSIEEVDSFDDYPDKWIGKSHDLFERDDLPLVRLAAVVRRGGPDELGRASMIQFRASHALLEGSDSALLMRSQSASHGIMSDTTNKVDPVKRAARAVLGWGLSSALLGVAYLLPPRAAPWGFRTLAIDRQRLRLVAKRLGIRQRSLYFALVEFALNGNDGALGRRSITTNYTVLAERRNSADDQFFRVRTIGARFHIGSDFVSFARGIEARTERLERKDTTDFQLVLNSSFAPLRWLHRHTGGRLPGFRFWNAVVPGKHIVLTLTPPHRTSGPFSADMIEPIYCGAWHNSANMCTFCPGREYITFNFSLAEHLLKEVDSIEVLLQKLEAMDIPPA